MRQIKLRNNPVYFHETTQRGLEICYVFLEPSIPSSSLAYHVVEFLTITIVADSVHTPIGFSTSPFTSILWNILRKRTPSVDSVVLCPDRDTFSEPQFSSTYSSVN